MEGEQERLEGIRLTYSPPWSWNHTDQNHKDLDFIGGPILKDQREKMQGVVKIQIQQEAQR